MKKNNNIKKSKDELEISLDQIKDLKILIIGETIIDQYVFCEGIGKSGKDPFMIMKDLKSKYYLGGAAVIARNLSNFNSKITFLSALGDKFQYKSFVESRLGKKVKSNFINKYQSPTIVKKRYIEDISKYKMLGIYSVNDEPLNKMQEEKFNKLLTKAIPKHDLIIVCDYGHGLITKKIANKIYKSSKFLAVNAQINANNRNNYSIKKYKNLDCLVINESEIRNELRDKFSNIEKIILRLTKELNLKNCLVTMGKNGSVCYSKKYSKFFYSKAYATKVVDKVGAGDSLLGFFASFLSLNININTSMFISSIIAAISVENLANSFSITRKSILNKAKTHIENIK